MTWAFLGFGSSETSIGGDNAEDFRYRSLDNVIRLPFNKYSCFVASKVLYISIYIFKC
jgi:hypothetical protein